MMACATAAALGGYATSRYPLVETPVSPAAVVRRGPGHYAAYPGMTLKEIRYSDGQRDKAMTETRNMLNKYPDLKGVMAIAAPAVPGAGEALKQSNRTDIKLTGLSVPSLCRTYVHDDFIDSIILWNTVDLGYLTVQAAKAVAEGTLKDGVQDFGRLSKIEVGDGNVYLGKPFVFNKSNIDNFDF